MLAKLFSNQLGSNHTWGTGGALAESARGDCLRFPRPLGTRACVVAKPHCLTFGSRTLLGREPALAATEQISHPPRDALETGGCPTPASSLLHGRMVFVLETRFLNH